MTTSKFKLISDPYLVTYVDQKIAHNRRKEPKRNYLGASSIGKDCMRQIQYDYIGQEPDIENDGQTFRIFDVGKKLESTIIDWFANDCQFKIQTCEENGEQIGFASANGQFQGHVDGIITEVPTSIPITCPAIIEIKTANDKKMRELKSMGFMHTYKQYYVQLQIYMGALNLTNPAIIVFFGKNDSSLQIIQVPFNINDYNEYMIKAKTILEATAQKSILPRSYEDISSFPCSYCKYKFTCYSEKNS